MAWLNATDITVEYAGEPILRDISLQLNPGDRVGLVGRNGAGKTTLLRVLAGQLHPSQGQVSVAGAVRIGWLQQEESESDQVSGQAGPAGVQLAVGITVWEYATAACPARQAEEQLQAVQQRLSHNPHNHALLHQLDEATARYEAVGGANWLPLARTTLSHLGLPAATAAQQLWAELSGGQQVRARLARTLLETPDILLLDEPTNHLDLEAISWLEQFLQRWSGALLVVSHDRLFLDRVVQRIIALDGGRACEYPGNYSQYVELREQEATQEQERYEQDQEERARLQAYIDKYRAGNRATMAKSREKWLARLGPAAVRPTSAPELAVGFPEPLPCGREVLRWHDLAVGYVPDRPVLTKLNGRLDQGEHLALVGPNGAGKSTFLKTIAGELPALAGQLKLGVGVRAAYFAQDLSQLPTHQTVLDATMATGRVAGQAQARTLLARFLFRGDDVFAPVSTLSGGEKCRLALLHLMLSGANLLLLDEPTNHLDLPSREALELALAQWPGTVIVVSHDRFFLARVAQRFVHLEGGHDTWIEGGWPAYEQWFNDRLSASQASARAAAPPRCAGAPRQRRPATTARQETDSRVFGRGAPSAGTPPPHLRPAQLRQLRQQIRAWEEQINALEAEKEHLARSLEDPNLYRQGNPAATVHRYEQVGQELEILYQQWTSATEQLEKATPALDKNHS